MDIHSFLEGIEGSHLPGHQLHNRQQTFPDQSQTEKLPSILSEEQVRQIDRVEYPPTILHSTVTRQHLSPDVKTWGDLESWVSKNQHLMSTDILEKLNGSQRLHFASLGNRKAQQHRLKRKGQFQDSITEQSYQAPGQLDPTQLGSEVPVALANDIGAPVQLAHLSENEVDIRLRRRQERRSMINAAHRGDGQEFGPEIMEASQIQAINDFKQDVGECEQEFGLGSPFTLEAAADLGDLYRAYGKLEAAVAIYQWTLDIFKEETDLVHFSTLLSTMANLANVYADQGRWKDAEELAMQTIEARKRVLAPEGPDTLVSMANLALIYKAQGRFLEAENLYVQVIGAQQRMLGPEHSATQTSLNALKAIYVEQGRGEEAEELAKQAMERAELKDTA